jgi:photosystem II stability/assembly factor-like uncharacterized protein
VAFTDANHGFIVGNNDSIYTTTDAGSNWSSTEIGQIGDATSICFTNNNVGYICSVWDSIVMKTIDGGNTWTQTSKPGSCILNSMFFLNADTGYVSGMSTLGSGNLMFMKTYDGGNTWIQHDIPSYFYNTNISTWFMNSNIGFVTVSGKVLKTIDGGDSWTAMNCETTDELNSIYFSDPNTGYIVGENGKILKTVDGGTNWIQLNNNNHNQLNSVFFIDNNTGYIAGSGIILKTNNGGQTWETIYKNVNSVFNSIFFTSALEGYAVGENGLIVKITDIDDATYSWQPTAGLNNPNIANPIAKPTAATTYKVTITPNPSTGCSSVYADSVKVNYAPFTTPEICLVSLRNNKNFIIWDKPMSSSIDSFYVWRESDISNVYDKIGATAYSDSSFFVDNTSNPDIQSNKYKISILDECGMESAKSDIVHKTMHLSINQGTTANTWNLIWEAYEGFTVSTYKIFRGTSRDNMTLIGTTSGSGSTQYSDYTAPSGYVYYQVQVVSPNICNPSKSINTTASNIATNDPNGISENSSTQNLKVFPNPTTGIVNIKFFDKASQSQEIIITDMLGNVVLTETISNQTAARLDLSGLSNGIYSLTVSNSKNSTTEKIVLQK